MDNDVSVRSGFVLRFLGLCALTAGLLFIALVLLDNDELTKIIPDTTQRSLALMFMYLFTIVSVNYLMALQGRNFMGWKVESALVMFLGVSFASFFLPYAFPLEHIEKEETLLGLWNREEVSLVPDWRFLWALLLNVPVATYAVWKMRAMPIWRKSL